jgi:hypothetical protein
MRQLARLPVVALLATLTVNGLAAGDAIPRCLNGTFTQGDEKTPVAPCGVDTLGIGADTDVLAVMRAFDIPKGVVAFEACPGGRFSAMPGDGEGKRYLVRYPSHVKANYLSPVVHELAHVVQMRSAGGLAALNLKESTRRIELGADFLAGLAFNIALKRLNYSDFETNLQLAGSYNVVADDHGAPEDRAQAFRRGATRKDPYPELTIGEAMTYWNANDYARIR